MAHRAAEATGVFLEKPFFREPQLEDWRSDSVRNLREASQIHSLWTTLRASMSSLAGIIRTERGLRNLLEDLTNWRKRTEEYYWDHEVTQDAIELRNITYLAYALAQQALAIRESRGGHYREDYPNKIS
jgi:L-aspartate oxidase